MGKRISATVRQVGGRWSIVALALIACLAVVGCAERDRAADENRSGGFYGGASVGR